MQKFKVGTVTHYYEHLGVVVVSLDSEIVAGDTLVFEWDDNTHTQKATVLQKDKETVTRAKKGESVVIEVEKEVAVGALVWLIG